MLNTFYTTIFKPGHAPLVPALNLLISSLVLVVLALNAAGTFHIGLAGFLVLFVLFLIAGLLGCYWLTASLYICAHLIGGQGTGMQTFQAILRGLWPLLLSGAAISLSKLSGSLGSLFSLSLMLGTLITVSGSVGQVHALNRPTAFVAVLLTLGLSGLAVFGLLIWPFMVLGGL